MYLLVQVINISDTNTLDIATEIRGFNYYSLNRGALLQVRLNLAKFFINVIIGINFKQMCIPKDQTVHLYYQ